MAQITRTIAIQTEEGAQVYTVGDLDFTNLVCDLEAQGIDIMSMMDDGFDRSKLMTTTRALLSVMINVPTKEAGRMITQHLGNGGAITDIFGVFQEAMADAGFGKRPQPQDHKKPTATKGRRTTKK